MPSTWGGVKWRYLIKINIIIPAGRGVAKYRFIVKFAVIFIYIAGKTSKNRKRFPKLCVGGSTPLRDASYLYLHFRLHFVNYHRERYS